MVESTTTLRSICDERLDHVSRQAASWPAVGVDARCARYVGRVGALAVALGVGIAVAGGFGAGTGVAWADQGAAASDNGPTADTASAAVGDPVSGQGAKSDGPDSGNNKADGNAEGVDSGSGMNVGASGGLDSSANDSGQSTDAAAKHGDDAAETPGPHPDLSTETVKTSATTSPEVSKKSAHKKDSDSASSTPASIPRDTMSQDVASVGAPTLVAVSAPTAAGSSEAPVRRTVAAQVPTTSRLTVADSSITPVQGPAGISGALVDVASRFVAAILSPFLSSGTGAPAEPPLAWAFLAFARREIDSLLSAHEPVSAPILNSVTVDSLPVSMAAAAAANSAPTAVPDNATATRNIARTFTAAQLVGNDTDPDGDALAVDSVSGAVNGTVVKNADGTVTFTPTKVRGVVHLPGRRLLGSGEHQLRQGQHHRYRERIAPTAVSDTATINRTVATTFTAAQLVGNDTDPDIANGDTLTVKSVSGAVHGTVVKNTDGTVTFTPTANYSGPASSRTRSPTSLAHQRQRRHRQYHRRRVNQAPTAVADSATVGRNAATTFTAAQLVATTPTPTARPESQLRQRRHQRHRRQQRQRHSHLHPHRQLHRTGVVQLPVADTSGAVSTNSAPSAHRHRQPSTHRGRRQRVHRQKHSADIHRRTVGGNDTDPDGDALVVNSVDPPSTAPSSTTPTAPSPSPPPPTTPDRRHSTTGSTTHRSHQHQLRHRQHHRRRSTRHRPRSPTAFTVTKNTPSR